MHDQDAHEKARKRVEAKFGFYVHLTVYVAVNILLLVLNLTHSPQYLWFLWPLFGWGIGIGFHALAIFVFSPGSAIKEQMIEREMKRQKAGEKESPK
jgi:hypothetical protein